MLHPIPAVYDKRSRILILGSFPSVASRETAFFYGHPQNRFWRVLGSVFGEKVPQDVPGKRQYLLKHHIALWDVIAECEVIGSMDASIRDAVPNDLSPIFDTAQILRVFTNGKTAHRLYTRYLAPRFGEGVCLPSTSPANAAWSLDRLVSEWTAIKDALI